MIFNPIVQKNTVTIVSATTTDEWVRSADWIAIPDIATGEEVAYLLNAVYDNNSNFIAFTFQGNYTVDWGDGNIENVNSGVKAQHQYNYADCGNLSERGYKQVLIKVTPQGGSNLTLINLQQVHSSLSLISNNLIDIVVSMHHCTSMAFGTMNKKVERCWIKEKGTLVVYGALFYQFSSLQSVPIFDTSEMTDMSSFFRDCTSLKNAPLLNTINVINMSMMFANDKSLKNVPLYDTRNVENMNQMFVGCDTIQQIPQFNTIKVTDMYAMFYLCLYLQTIPELNTPALLYMSSALRTGVILTTVSFSNMSSVADISGVFYGNTNISSCIFTGLKISFDISGNKMSAEALNALGNSVADLTALPSATVTVTGNFGAATMDDTIWTNKNWSIIK